LTQNIQYTGTSDYNLANEYIQYYGYKKVTLINDIPGTDCLQIGNPNRTTGFSVDCKLWTNTEVIEGSRDGLQSTMFNEGTSNIVNNIPIWVSEAKRVVNFSYEEDISFKDINLRRYRITDSQFLLTNPVTTGNYWFLENYIAPMGRYLGGLDGFLCQPNFYGDQLPALNPNITRGMVASNFDPSMELHKTYLDIEPFSGATFAGRKRLQVGFDLSNQRLSPYSPWSKIYANFTHLQPIHVPLAWGEEGKDISDADASTFRSGVYGNRTMAWRVMLGLVISGSALLAFAIFWVIKASRLDETTTTTNN